jgi:gas vesicle protein
VYEKERKMDTNGSARSFFRGFIIGGAMGALTAVLIAPQSGEETRSQIRMKSAELREKAEATYADVQQRVEATVADLRHQVDELSTKVDEVMVQVRGDPSQRAGEMAEEMAPDKSTV